MGAKAWFSYALKILDNRGFCSFSTVPDFVSDNFRFVPDYPRLWFLLVGKIWDGRKSAKFPIV